MPTNAMAVTFATIGLAILAAAPAAERQATQQPAPPPARPESPSPVRSIFRAGVEYVAVDIVVTDQHDKLVSDLTAKDFEVREDERVQKILDFSHISVPVNRRSVDLQGVPAPPPDVASNPVPSPSSRAFVFVVDDGALRAEDLVKLKRVMTRFLEELSSDDRTAVVYIHRSDLGMDFTTDVVQLSGAVDNLRAAVGWLPDPWATRKVLDNTVSLLANAPETRRTVIYVSSGFEVCPGPTAELYKNCDGLDVVGFNGGPPPPLFTIRGLDDLFERAKSADVTIYTLDPQGLRAPSLNLTGYLEDHTPENRARADFQSRHFQDFLRSVAGNTGGLAFTNTNDLDWAVDGVMTDNSDYYVLGYSPSPYAADDKFHAFDVHVVTRPGLHVRARRGYVASKRAATPDEHGRLMTAMSDAEPHSDLGLQAFAAPVATTPNGATTIVTLDVSYPAVTSNQERADDDLLVTYVAADADGQVMKAEPRTFHVALSSATQDAVDLSIDDVMTLPKGHWTLVIGASSQLLDKVGTLHLPIDVRALPGSGLETSPLILGLTAKIPTRVAQAERIAKLVPFQPTTARTFTSGQLLRVFSRVFAAKPAGLRTELRVTRGNTVVQTLPLHIAPTPSVDGAENCEATLDLKELQPGDYVLEFSAQLSGKQPTTRAVGFRVQ